MLSHLKPLVPALLGNLLLASAVQSQTLYWVNERKEAIQRLRPDSSVDTTLINHVAYPIGLTWDAANSTIVWADYGLGAIQKYSIQGQNVTTILGELLEPTDAVVAVSSGKIYWACTTGICRVDADGQNPEPVLEVFGWVPPFGVDEAQGKIYLVSPWSAIERANLDGTNAETLVSAFWIDAVALDAQNGFVYWVEQSAQYTTMLRRMPLKGGTAQDLLDLTGTYVWRIAIDPAGERVYWSSKAGIETLTIGSTDRLLFTETGDGLVSGLTVADDSVFWIDSKYNRLLRRAIAGGAIEIAVDANWAGDGELLLDGATGQLLIANENGVERRKSDGTWIEQVTPLALRSISADFGENRFYGIHSNSILSLDLRSHEGQSIYQSPSGAPVAMTLVLHEKRIQWVEQDSMGGITSWKANTDGTQIEQTTCALPLPPRLLLAPPGMESIYAATPYEAGATTYDAIRRFPALCAFPFEPIVATQTEIRGLAVDMPRSRLYWTHKSDPPRVIRRSDLEGDGLETLSDEGHFPTTLAVDACDREGGVRHVDHALLAQCAGGPENPISGLCHCSDLSADGRADLKDYAVFQRAYDADPP